MTPVGVDLGGVVVEKWQWLPGAAWALDVLNVERGVYIVSKCGPRMERLSREWLVDQEFARLTGVTPDRWWFVRNRADKGPVASVLELGAFVDNRQECLDSMPTTVQRVLFTDWESALEALL